MQCLQYLLIILVTFCFASSSRAENGYSMRIDPATKDRYFTFTSSKGNVRFNHDMHQTVMKAESCIPCHKTKTPTKALTMIKFDQRYAHAFCRGCHRETDRGPLECHQCHKEN